MKTLLHRWVPATQKISSRFLYCTTFSVLFLLVAPQAFAQDLRTTISSTPANNSTALGNTTVTFTAITVSPGGGVFNGVRQEIQISGVSAAVYASLTFTGGTASHNAATQTATIVFSRGNLANNGTRSESVTFTVPDDVPTTVILAKALYTENGSDTDPDDSNNNGSMANAQSTITLKPLLAIASFAPVRNALVAARNASVEVTYNQPVTSASASNIRIFSNQRGGLVTAATSVSGNKATLKPGLFFKAGEVVNVTVPRTVVNSDGQETSNPQVYQFTTATENGTGVFTSIADLVTGTNPSNQALADFDGDNKLDLAAANYGNGTGNTVSVSRYTGGSGTPSLAAKQDFTITGQQGIYNIAAGDFNNDGKIDLVTANNASNSISILRNTNTTPGSITPSSFAASVSLTVGTGPTAVAVGDIDGDGYLDIVTANQGTTTVSVLRNTTVGTTITFAAAQTYQVGTGTRPYGLTINDIDGDGKLDLITANSGTNTASVLRNNTTGIGALTASSFSAATSFAVGTGPYAVVAGDLNADGLLDLVTVNNTANTISILRNTTTGAGNAFTFAAKQDITVGTLPVGLAIGDINSDGKLDIIASDYGSSGSTGTGTTVSLLQNTTTATTITMAARRTVTVGNGPNSVALGDLDGDGDLDIVTANQGGDNNTASIRINNTSQAPLPLPVSLLDFTAVATGNQVRINWSTAMELNNAYFEVERSLDAVTFVPVGRVAGNGTTTQGNQYSLLDNVVQGNVLYYRLRQVDLDATVHYSAMRTVTLRDAAGLTLMPNPAPGAVSVNLTTVPAGTYTIQVLDMTGRALSTQQVTGGQQVLIEASQMLHRGIYFVRIDGNNMHVIKRLVKE